MDLTTALARMEELLALMDEYQVLRLTSAEKSFSPEKADRIISLYGEIEEVLHQFDGVQEIKVEKRFASPSLHKDWISAGWLSGGFHHRADGRTQLVKVIGKVKSRLVDPGSPEPPTSVDQVSRILRRFRECCQFISVPPASEREVQDIVWVMLRAQFERVDREDTLPRFGAKSYRPDFGVPDVRALVEVKYIGSKTVLADIQEEILADVPGYLRKNPGYAAIIVFVYDGANRLLEARKFIEDLRTVDGIIDVIVVPGVGDATKRPA